MKNLKYLFVSLVLVLSSCSDKQSKTDQIPTNKTNKSSVLKKETEKTPSTEQLSQDISYQFELNLELGKNYQYAIKETETTERFLTAGKEQKRQSIQNQSYDVLNFACKDFTNKLYTLEVSILRKSLKVQADGKTQSIDTNDSEPRDTEEKKMWSIQRAFIGKPFFVKVSKFGKVKDVMGLDNLYTSIAQSLKDILKPSEIQELVRGVKDMLNKEAFAQQFEGTFIEFPKNGVKIGQTWEVKHKKNPQNTISYTLANLSEETVEVKVKSLAEKKSKSKTKNGVTMTITVEGSQDGVIVLDRKSGWIKNAKLTTKMSEKMVLSDGKNSETQLKRITNLTEINP